MIQYRVALVITKAIKGASRDRLYQETSLESLADRKWYRNIIFFHKIVSDKVSISKQDEDFLEKPKLLIHLFIHTLLSNGVHLVKKFE